MQLVEVGEADQGRLHCHCVSLAWSNVPDYPVAHAVELKLYQNQAKLCNLKPAQAGCEGHSLYTLAG